MCDGNVCGQLSGDPMPEPLNQTPALRRVTKGALCAGCGACAAVARDAIKMEVSTKGFLRPRQVASVSAEDDARIERVCPGLVQKVSIEGRTDHPLWGPYVSMQTGFSTDAELRYKGSSGGALSGLLTWLLESGEVEAVLTNAADPDQVVGNIPILARNRDDIARAAGSRYSPSAPLAGLGLADGHPTAFVGKPCDAAAFRAMEAEDPSLSERFPIVVSFFCAGVPSLEGGEAILNTLGVSPEKTASFRYRGHGWPGRATATAHDGSEASMTYNESWGQILSSRVQHRCKLCADGTGVAADIVCADAWETDERGYPLFEEADGISLIVARTQKGADLLARAESAGAISIGPFDVGVLQSIQPGQTRRRQALSARLLGQRILGRPVPIYRGLGIAQAAKGGSLKWRLRNLIGMIRRGVGRYPE